MDARAFHNALRVMRNIGENKLREFGVIDENWGTPEASERDQLGSFFADPYSEAIRMPDANFDRLFALIESRQPQRAAFNMLAELKRAEAFISGFEGDDTQVGVAELLADIRSAVSKAEARS